MEITRIYVKMMTTTREGTCPTTARTEIDCSTKQKQSEKVGLVSSSRVLLIFRHIYTAIRKAKKHTNSNQAFRERGSDHSHQILGNAPAITCSTSQAFIMNILLVPYWVRSCKGKEEDTVASRGTERRGKIGASEWGKHVKRDESSGPCC